MMTFEGLTFAVELPGPGPWKLTHIDAGIIACSPHHAPLLIRDGVVSVIEPAAPSSTP